MADEELRELELTHGYGGSGGRWSGGGGGGASWGRSPGGGGSLSHQRMAPSQHHSNRAAEAEDIMGRAQVNNRSNLCYRNLYLLFPTSEVYVHVYINIKTL